MCGINGVLSLSSETVPELGRRLRVMNGLQRHRGPDGDGIWEHESGRVGFGHTRLSIIDVAGAWQPMLDERANCLTYNGEIYNYVELRRELGPERFRTNSDTETILHAWDRWGQNCLHHLRGMFAFALWDEPSRTLFAARDRFGIKPFCYARVGDRLYFASEAKALLPFLPNVDVDRQALHDYLTFQFYLDGKTMFDGINELPPGHCLTVRNGQLSVQRYWEVYYDLDLDHTEGWFRRQITEQMRDSVKVHLRSDVPVGSYLSGGLDSSIIASLASGESPDGFRGYVGKFTDRPGFDESDYARLLAADCEFPLEESDITPRDFTDVIRKVIYHLDQPIAGPGSFPQYVVSELASRKHKVVLGGQGGDEIFGGYARYLIAYFEQCIKGAIEGTNRDADYVVTYESIIPNLSALRNYKPLLQHFWRDGLFEPMDRRYFRLVNRAPALGDAIRWELLGDYSALDSFRCLFNSSNVRRESYFDQMTHFDCKTLLPALLHVEDRVSMAHGLESRVPFLDHPLVETAATIPANVKFKGGRLKHLLQSCFEPVLPAAIAQRTDKMGFPVPLSDWMQGPIAEFVCDVFGSQAAGSRAFVDNRRVSESLATPGKFDRTLWGLMSLELWYQEFIDRQAEFRRLMDSPPVVKAA
ncbi:MAG: asparagine synthase (glutamine-hydrolyzing) [Planctomycetaceae bacterium]